MPDPPMPQKKVGVIGSVVSFMPPDYGRRMTHPQGRGGSPTPLVAVIAPSCPIERGVADRVEAIVAGRLRLRWAEQCFASGGHYAGPDLMREDALVEALSDPEVAAIWCARGGAGAARIAAAALARTGAAPAKTVLGYSDTGFLHAAMLRTGRAGAVWGPMVSDVARVGGDQAIERAVRLLTDADLPEDHAATGAIAFNLSVLCATLGTPLEPPLGGRTLILEDVGEPLYRLDRLFGQLTTQPWFASVAGVRLGRFSDTGNDRPFGRTVEEIAGEWIARAGVPLLMPADIGHDAGNKLVRLA